MTGRIIHKIMGIAVLTAALWPASPAFAQKATTPAAPIQTLEQPDAERVKQQFRELLDHYPPTIRRVFKEDPTLMTQQQYLAPYPALLAFINQHPEIPLNPAFYLDGLANNRFQELPRSQTLEMWDDVLKAGIIFAGFSLAIGLLTWLIRTFIDFRRWNRLSKVQAEVHTRLLDRFNTNEELMAYIATPAGSKFLQSAPISLDDGAASRNMGAPLSRIMLSLQAGLVIAAAGVGLMVASRALVDREAADPLHVLGIIAIALGAGFAVSAAASFLISKNLGLFEPPSRQKGLESQDMPQ